jgi:hypothetical protein
VRQRYNGTHTHYHILIYITVLEVPVFLNGFVSFSSEVVRAEG